MSHILLIGFNIQLKRASGDKNFWFEGVKYLSSHVARITIISIEQMIDSKVEEVLIGNCIVRRHSIRPAFLETSNSVGKRKRVFWRGGAFPRKLAVIEKTLTSIRIIRFAREMYTQTQYDAVHLMDNFGPSNRLFALGLPVPVSVSACAYQPMGPEWFYKLFLTLSYRCRNLHPVAYSRTYREKLLKLGIKPEQVSNIPWAVSVPDTPDDVVGRAWRVKNGITDTDTIILWAGYIQQVRRNDFLYAYTIAKEIVSRRKSVHFIFAFKPENFETAFNELKGVNSNITLLKTSPEVFHQCKVASDIFFSPVVDRRNIIPPPLTWLEMLALGKPVITTNVPGADEIVFNGKNGIVGSTDNELIHAILQLSDGVNASMKKACIESVRIHYNLATSMNQYLKLWERNKIMQYPAKQKYQNNEVVARYDGARFTTLKGRLTNWLELHAMAKGLRCADILPGSKILDLPCGTGRMSLHFATQGYQVTGVDISLEMVELSQQKAKQMGLEQQCRFEVADGENLPFDENTFDVGVSLRLFGHTPPDVRVKIIRSLARASSRGLVLAYYSKHSLQGLLRKSKRAQRGIPWYPVDREQINNELSECGLKATAFFHVAPLLSESVIVVAQKT